jgi:uncharacterized protein with GYD domain
MLAASTEYSLPARITSRQQIARSFGANTMTTYIALFSLTDAGIKAAQDAAPARRGQEAPGRHGGEMKQFYMVMGEFDFVGICEDDAVMARYVLQLGGLGFVRTNTLKAFPETAYREIIRSLG